LGVTFGAAMAFVGVPYLDQRTALQTSPSVPSVPSVPAVPEVSGVAGASVYQHVLRDPCALSLAVLSSSAVLCHRKLRRLSRVSLRSKESTADVEERLREVESAMSMESMEDGSFYEVELDAEEQKISALRYSETRSLPRFLFLREPGYRTFAANVPGDLGFDPLGLCTDVRKFVEYREAELKHGRLAMFAAVAWPLAELVDENLVGSDSDSNAVDFLAETGGKMLPQIGENDTFVEVFAAVVLVVGGAVELFRGEGKDGNEPGDSGFDPLNVKGWRPPGLFSSLLPANRPWMGEAEVQHSRLAMLAVLYDILVELFTPNPVVEDTEYIFHKIDAKLLRWDYWALQPPTLDVGPDVQI